MGARRGPPVAQVEIVLNNLAQEIKSDQDFVGEFAEDFLAVLKTVISFVSSRIDRPPNYLREDGGGSSVLENELQNDLLEYLYAYGQIPEPVLEGQGIAAGRVDILVVWPSGRVILEVKREQADASQESIEGAYGSQAAAYTATGYPFGIVPVLDLVEPQAEAPRRLADCFWIGECNGRKLVFVVVQGRRATPSSL